MGTAYLGLSAGGTLAYYRATGRNLVVRVDRSGVASAIDSSWTADIVSLALSPDGTRLAVGAVVEGRGEIWVKTLPTGPFTRVSDAGSLNYRPFWSDDGRSIGYVSDASGSLAPYRVAADGSGDVESLTRIGRVVDEGLWSRDSKWLIVRAGSGGGRDILGIRPGVDSVPVPLVATPAEEYSPALSPDGKWLAYASYGSGRDEVYVRPFPETGKGRWQISVAGGTEPVWSHSGRELFYRDGASNLVAISVAFGTSFQLLGHRTLFSTQDYLTDTRHSAYAVSADDQSFIFAKQRSGLSNQLTVVQNWFEELKGRNPNP